MYSLGIPVRNEEKNIEWLVESIFDQTQLPDEILICVNNSKDRTKDIVLWMSEKYSIVKLLESEPWKANAWNKIVKNSSNNLMVFCDWDIGFWTNDTIEKLIEKLINENLTMLWASVIQLPSKRIIPYKLNFPSGQLYAIDLDVLWINCIPSNIINDDLFLTLLSYPHFSVSWESFFYSNKPNFWDILKTQYRILKGIKQIINFWMEEKMLKLIENKKFKYKLALYLSKLIPLSENDYLWSEAKSTKKELFL